MSKIVVSANKLNFGDVYTDSVYRMKFTMKNTGTKAITLKTIGFSHGEAAFKVENTTLPVTFQPDEVKEFTVRFQTPYSGNWNVELYFGDSCVSLWVLPVKANSIQPQIIATDIDFGTKSARQSYDSTYYIVNKSAIDINIIGIKSNKIAEFTTNLPPVPFIVPSDTTLAYNISFKSDQAGTFIDTLIFESQAGTNTDNKSIFKAVCEPNSIDDENGGSAANFSISVVPNPTSGGRTTVRINSDRECDADISVCNIAGEQLFNGRTYTVQAGENTIELDLSKLPCGTYYLLVKSCGRAERVKFSLVR